MALTPGKVVWQNDILQLIQYAPSTANVHETPLLIIPPWINKYYVLDLNEKKSMMKWLVAQGHTVFIISWANPDSRHKDQTWDSYMLDGALTNDKRVKSATFFTAQLDFEDAGELQVFVDEHTVELVDSQMDKGYLPAQTMAKAFNLLRSNDLIWSYVVNNYMLGKEPFPFDLLYWNSDSTAMPAQVHHHYLENCYLKNAFVKGEFEVMGAPISINNIKGPVYHIATVEDHIAPATSVYRGARQMGSADVTFVLSGSGHIAGVVNPPVLEKYQYWVNDDLSAETGAKLGAIEDAPGSYVKVRFDS